MLCPKCNHPIGVYATEDIVREHAEDYGYVKLPDVESLRHMVTPYMHSTYELAEALHSALQGGKHA